MPVRPNSTNGREKAEAKKAERQKLSKTTKKTTKQNKKPIAKKKKTVLKKKAKQRVV